LWNLQLTSFDAAKKLNLIKEVRSQLNLGLKESKDLVEKTPATLMKNVKKEEGQKLFDKLVENGAVMEWI
jgi:large subunit ribosomal protein L7/L12